MEVIISETLVKDLVLNAYHLSSEKDILRYKKLLQIFPNSPLYNFELLSFGKAHNEKLMFFVFSQHGKPLVLMPFWFRKIVVDGKETGYNDISSPYGYSGPLFVKNIDVKITSLFWKEVDHWYKRNKVVSEFIRFNTHENWKRYTGHIKPTLINVCGKIIPSDEQWTNFKPKVRNNYRKAVKNGLKSTVFFKNISIDIIEQFHKIYTHTMERKKASQQYFYNLEYFKDLILNNPSTCAITVVYKDDVPISTELLLLSDTTINSFLGGTLVDYFDTRPNDFLKIEVLDWGRENGFEYYFLGGGREDGDSLYQYKKDFFPSDEDRIFYTGRKIVDQVGYNFLASLIPYCENCNVGNYFPLYRCKHSCKQI